MVESAVSFANAYQEETYYNLDLANDRELTLQDVLGEDWVEKCNESIREQMDAAEDPSVYFTPDAGGFTTVDEDTQFYLNEAGNPVVVFPPYTVPLGPWGPWSLKLRNKESRKSPAHFRRRTLLYGRTSMNLNLARRRFRVYDRSISKMEGPS